eukprot:gene5214-biopygen33607
MELMIEPDRGYTVAEQRTLISLWSIARSILIMGGDLTGSPKEVLALLTNEAVLTMNARSHAAYEAFRKPNGAIAWTSRPGLMMEISYCRRAGRNDT